MVVKIPIKLVEAQYFLSLRGHRLRVLVFSKLKPIMYPLGSSSEIIITAKEWQDTFIESENPYRDLRKAAADLRAWKVTFSPNEESYRVLNYAKYDIGQGRVIIQFNPLFLKACIATG